MESAIQQAIFGRETQGAHDTLEGFIKSEIELGENVYPVIIPGEGSVNGVVLSLTENEIKKADLYETDAYMRAEVVLASGRKSWVYQKNERG